MLLMQEHYMECLFSITVLAVSTTVLKDVPNPRDHAIKNGRFYHSYLCRMCRILWAC